MASEQGVVIACRSKAEFDAHMTKAQEAGKLVVIDFTAAWCGPCRAIAPLFVEHAKKFTQVVFLKVDVDEVKEVTAAYEVEAMPTFHFVKNGKTVATIVGARKDELLALIEKHAAPAPASASA